MPLNRGDRAAGMLVPTVAGPGPIAPRIVAVLAAAAIGLVGLVTGCSGDDGGSEEPTFTFVIPAGTNDRIEQGEPLDILPRELVAQLDDTIMITNEDDRSHVLGPWYVGPGETLRQRFVTAGVFDGSCSVHPSGEFTVVVEA
jgi:hypothetical protein